MKYNVKCQVRSKSPTKKIIIFSPRFGSIFFSIPRLPIRARIFSIFPEPDKNPEYNRSIHPKSPKTGSTQDNLMPKDWRLFRTKFCLDNDKKTCAPYKVAARIRLFLPQCLYTYWETDPRIPLRTSSFPSKTRRAPQ